MYDVRHAATGVVMNATMTNSTKLTKYTASKTMI